MPAFVVEGVMERKIVQRLCPGSPVRLLGTGGRDVSPEAIVRFLEVQLKDLYNRVYPIFVVFDRERRAMTARELREAVSSILRGRGYEDNIFVSVADFSIENWIFSDTTLFNRNYGSVVHKYPGDGVGCAKKISMLLRSASEVYNKTTTGVDLFCGINPFVSRKNRESFRLFMDSARDHCDFLRE